MGEQRGGYSGGWPIMPRQSETGVEPGRAEAKRPSVAALPVRVGPGLRWLC
jgi:hypothetical protein